MISDAYFVLQSTFVYTGIGLEYTQCFKLTPRSFMSFGSEIIFNVEQM